MILFTCNKNFIDRLSINSFIKIILPKIIIEKISLKNNITPINKSIENQFNQKISLNQIIKTFIRNLHIREDKEDFQIILEDNIKIKGIYLNTLIRFIDSGNLSTKGLNIFSEAIKYAKDNIYDYSQGMPLLFF